MNFENIRFEKKDQIAYITIDRPQVLNALNTATMSELRAVFTQLKDDREVRVVILTGGGEKSFVAGADIGELQKNNPVEAKEYTHRGQEVIDLIENLGKPVIACINGFALGGGCEIAMACTMRLATDSAKLGQPEVKLGCGYPMGPFTLLDFVGLDTTYYITHVMYDEFKERRFASPPLLKRLVLAGWYGKKTGKGFYDWSDAKNPVPVKL